MEALPQEVQLGLAHGPFEPQQQPVIVHGRIIDAVQVCQQGVEDRRIDPGDGTSRSWRDSRLTWKPKMIPT